VHGPLRLDVAVEGLAGLDVVNQLDAAHLDDAVDLGVGAGGLGVEDDFARHAAWCFPFACDSPTGTAAQAFFVCAVATCFRLDPALYRTGAASEKASPVRGGLFFPTAALIRGPLDGLHHGGAGHLPELSPPGPPARAFSRSARNRGLGSDTSPSLYAVEALTEFSQERRDCLSWDPIVPAFAGPYTP
jgi:hypothetical protein